MRFLRGPFVALLARMAALICFLVAIVPLQLSRRIRQLAHRTRKICRSRINCSLATMRKS